MGGQTESCWRAGYKEPTWFRDPLVANCRDAALLAHREFLDLVPSGRLPRRPSVEQLLARHRVIDADAAYEEAKVRALQSCEV
jgi:hypothetical protein